jgi:hypothetical protein
LRVVVYGLQGAVYAAEDPLQLHLQLDLGLDALDPQLHLVDVGIDAHVDVQEADQLRPGRDVRPQLLDLEVQLLDVENWDVEDDVGVVLARGLRPRLSSRRSSGSRCVTPIFHGRMHLVVVFCLGAPVVPGINVANLNDCHPFVV